MIPTTIFII